MGPHKFLFKNESTYLTVYLIETVHEFAPFKVVPVTIPFILLTLSMSLLLLPEWKNIEDVCKTRPKH